MNYASHAAESRTPVPAYPATFTKFPSCIVGPRAVVGLLSGRVDWEIELVVVIGTEAHGVDELKAMDFVALGDGQLVAVFAWTDCDRSHAGTTVTWQTPRSRPGLGRSSIRGGVRTLFRLRVGPARAVHLSSRNRRRQPLADAAMAMVTAPLTCRVAVAVDRPRPAQQTGEDARGAADAGDYVAGAVPRAPGRFWSAETERSPHPTWMWTWARPPNGGRDRDSLGGWRHSSGVSQVGAFSPPPTPGLNQAVKPKKGPEVVPLPGWSLPHRAQHRYRFPSSVLLVRQTWCRFVRHISVWRFMVASVSRLWWLRCGGC